MAKTARSLKPFTPGRGYSHADYDAVADNPELTEKELQQLRPFADVFPDLAATIKTGRGPQKAPTKKLIALRLDGEVIDKFKNTGKGWQSRMNEVLRKAKI